MGLGNNYSLAKQTLCTEHLTMLQKSKGVNETVILVTTLANTIASPLKQKRLSYRQLERFAFTGR